MNEPERGSAPLEAVFAIALLLFLVLGAIEVVWALYGRNVLMSSAHEGARAAVELGASSSDAVALATGSIERSAGGIVEDLEVAASVQTMEGRSIVNVEVRGVLVPWGPVPLPLPVRTAATVSSTSAPGEGSEG